MAVTVDAQAQAAAGEGITVGRRVHTVRHGQGKTAWTERLETEVVGIAGLTTYDQYGTPEHGRHHNRRDFQPNPINAVVVRKWHGRDYGPGGKTVFLTNAPVEKPLQPFDDYDDRSLIENCCIKESKQQWSLKHPPQKTARAVHVHVLFTLLMFALATAYRLQCEQDDTGERAGRLAALATPAPGADPGPRHRLCPGLLRHLSYGGVLAAVGGPAQGCASWHRHAPGHSRKIWAPSAWLTLYSNLRSFPIPELDHRNAGWVSLDPDAGSPRPPD